VCCARSLLAGAKHHTPSRPSASLSFFLSSCLGNIEVIMLFSFSMCNSAVLDR